MKLSSAIQGRDSARARAKRYAKFLAEVTAHLRKTRAHIAELRKSLDSTARKRAKLDTALQQARNEVEVAKRQGDKAEVARLRNNVEALSERRSQADARLEHLEQRIKEERARAKKLKHRAKRAFVKRRFWRKRIRMFIAKVRHLRELKKQREKEQPEFKPWMANGHDWQHCDKAVLDWAARAVVLYGLAITSLYRNFVPPGGSTTSFHLTGEAGDAAGSWDRMVAAQHHEYKRGKGDSGCKELFGPDNATWLKYGQHMPIAEGTPLENLHDTHIHEAR